jgi:peroxiredoxin
MRKLILLLSAVLIACGFGLEASTASSPAKLTPENPKWSDTITVTYDPAVKGAKFLPGDTVYAYYDLKLLKSSQTGFMKMELKDGKFTCDIMIPEGASFIYVDVITMDGWDDRSHLNSMIFRRDGVPAERAWMWKMAADSSETGYLDAFKNERKLYPQDYLVYRNKWCADAFYKKNDLKAIIGREIKDLKKPSVKESPGLLWALSCGYLLLDDEKACREELVRMVRLYPDSEETPWALNEYDYQAFSKQFKGEGPEKVKRLKLELARRDPTSKILRDYILLWVAYEKNPPMDIVRPGFESWIKEQPNNPTPYYTLAKVLLEKNEAMNEAAGLIEKALDRLVAGKWRFFGDFSGDMTERALPNYYATAAGIHEKLGDMSTALAEIDAAQNMAKAENRPDLFMREASIWQKLGYFDKAEKSLLEARRRGAKDADGMLREIYSQRRQTDEGFEAWLGGKTEKQSLSSSGDKKAAPGFEVKTLDGESLRLADLKGKVVVLNFWYVGCAPCQVEIPGLNKLVEEFKSEEVVFVGFALDDEGRLHEFLKTNPFKYKIVAKSSSIAKGYGVSVYPTHILINKQGQIEFTMTGGSPERHEELRPLIRSLLK